jgi:hypothetical protein
MCQGKHIVVQNTKIVQNGYLHEMNCHAVLETTSMQKQYYFLMRLQKKSQSITFNYMSEERAAPSPSTSQGL